MAQVLVPVADGSEEIEAVTVIDVLRRAEADVCVASVMPHQTVTASRGVVLHADALLADCVDRPWDLIVLPGGLPGSERFQHCEPLVAMLREQLAAGRWVGAICAAPAVVLGRHGLLTGFRATANPGFQAELADQTDSVSTEPVVCDRHLITSQAPGTAMAFALTLVACLLGEEKAESLAGPLVTPWSRS